VERIGGKDGRAAGHVDALAERPRRKDDGEAALAEEVLDGDAVLLGEELVVETKPRVPTRLAYKIIHST
jgi:hypothetical protein